MRPNRLKRRLARGELARGLSMMIPSPQLVEMAGHVGFDWVLLDCEHGTMTPESVETMTMAAELTGMTAIARPRSSTPEDILEVLERGVAGVQVPHVRSAQEAADVVAAVRFHPAGRRSLAARTRPAAYGLSGSLAEFARAANDELLVCVQIEDTQALGCLEEIVAVPGVDVVFIGPADLSQSLGHPGDAGHPDVRKAMARAFDTITRSGLHAGSAGTALRWTEYLDQGVLYVYTHLPGILADGSSQYLALGAGDRVGTPELSALDKP
jgi:4-hydroxy-2-oxoheptanedioate aldolase